MLVLLMNCETRDVPEMDTLERAIRENVPHELGAHESIKHHGVTYVGYYVQGTEYHREIHVWRLW